MMKKKRNIFGSQKTRKLLAKMKKNVIRMQTLSGHKFWSEQKNENMNGYIVADNTK